jgi:hypothetical protein
VLRRGDSWPGHVHGRAHDALGMALGALGTTCASPRDFLSGNGGARQLQGGKGKLRDMGARVEGEEKGGGCTMCAMAGMAWLCHAWLAPLGLWCFDWV